MEIIPPLHYAIINLNSLMKKNQIEYILAKFERAKNKDKIE